MVRRLSPVSKGLRHAAMCPAPSHAECPAFRKLPKAALVPAPTELRLGTTGPGAKRRTL
jgi:hypothetical protein